jgi:hypothetical protein
MQILGWNSQGDEWDTFWNNFLARLVSDQKDDVIGLLTEASWAPWMLPDTKSDPNATVSVFNTVVYDFEWREGNTGYVPGKESPFCTGIKANRSRKAFWVPWVGNFNAATNSRCSMGAAFLLKRSTMGSNQTYVELPQLKLKDVFRRPAVRFDLKYAGNVWFTVFLVHLVSGWQAGAQDELDTLAKAVSTIVPQGTPAIIVGDLNINIRNVATHAITVPKGWSVLRSNKRTQRSGGELDFALLYDPKGSFQEASCEVKCPYDTHPNTSDHSVMSYVLRR